MKRFIISWTLPFVMAFVIVVFLKFFFIRIDLVSDYGMTNTLMKNDKVVCLSVSKIDRNTIVIFHLTNEKETKFRRIVALPSDTILIKHSILYVNRKRSDDNRIISFEYTLSTDSIAYTAKLLDTNDLMFNPKLATIGVFQFNAGLNGLKKVKTDSLHFNVKRIIEDPAVAESGNIVFHSSLYWNKDNMGPLIVPGKGKRVRLPGKVYYLYKDIIEKESGKKLELINNQAYLAKKVLDYYAFKQNYYFLLSDNRQDANDSRTNGFISEDQIISKYWFKLPW